MLETSPITAETSRLHLVKKVQRAFVVEYKSGRRKSDPKSNSIWGNMDLKSIARDVDTTAIPPLTSGEQDATPDDTVFLPDVNGNGPSLTHSIGHSTAAHATIMAEENNTTTDHDRRAAVVAALHPPTKQRKPRARRAAPEVAPETASSEAPAEAAAALNTNAGKRGAQWRGPKQKASAAAISAKSPPLRRASKPVKAAIAALAVTIDEMADLVQLEDENLLLRRLLAEKLRAENADLRKRLGLG
jgi:hypothetical protein